MYLRVVLPGVCFDVPITSDAFGQKAVECVSMCVCVYKAENECLTNCYTVKRRGFYMVLIKCGYTYCV